MLGAPTPSVILTGFSNKKQFIPPCLPQFIGGERERRRKGRGEEGEERRERRGGRGRGGEMRGEGERRGGGGEERREGRGGPGGGEENL